MNSVAQTRGVYSKRGGVTQKTIVETDQMKQTAAQVLLDRPVQSVSLLATLTTSAFQRASTVTKKMTVWMAVTKLAAVS